MKTGIDMANYSGAPNASWEPLAAQIDLCAPQALQPPPGYPPGVTAQQVQWSLEHGKVTVPYVWKWFGTGLDDVKRRVDLLTPFTGQIDALAMDIEDTYVPALASARRTVPALPWGAFQRIKRQPPPVYPGGGERSATMGSSTLDARVAELQAAFDYCDTFPTKSGLKTLNYSGAWYWRGYLGNTTAFATQRHNWGALYDNIYDPNVWTPWGGWTDLAIKQPAGTSTLAGIGNLDPDVIADWFWPLLTGGGGAPVVAHQLAISGPGIDVDPLVPGADLDPARLAALGFTWARFVERQDPKVVAYADALAAAGLVPVGVVTGQTQGQMLANVKIKIFGNEWDTDESNPAKWPAGDAANYAQQLATYTGTDPQFDFLIGGLASGDPNVGALREVLAAGLPANVVGVSVHPWAKGIIEARGWLSQVIAVAAAAGLKAVIGEYNRPPEEIVEYCSGLRWLDGVQAWAWYCLSDQQSVPSEGVAFGLFDMQGHPKAELSALRTAQRPGDVDWAWTDKKAAVVQAAGELSTIAQQIEAEVANPLSAVRHLKNLEDLAAQVRQRANAILQ